MIKNVTLITAQHKQRPSAEAQRGLSAQVKFRYDFVKRYFANQEGISRWEEISNIPEDCKLGNLIATHWNRYCRQVVETLQDKLDMVRICINLPSSVSEKTTGVEVLQEVANDIRDSIDCISQIVDHEELRGNDSKLITFGDSANSNFNDLLKQNVDELILFCKNSIEKTNLVRKIQSLYFLLFIIHLPEVKERAGHQFLEEFTTYFEECISEIEDSILLESVQNGLSELKVDYKEETVKIFSVILFEKLALKAESRAALQRQADYAAMSKYLQTGVIDLSSVSLNQFYQSIRVTCSVFVPFTVFLRCGRPPTESSTVEPTVRTQRLQVAKLDFDGFTLKEYMTQSLPN